jgi:hypothetical protein
MTAQRRKAGIVSTAQPRLAVYDGARCCGHIVARDGKFVAFDQNDNLVGTFASQAAAVRALPDGGEP